MKAILGVDKYDDFGEKIDSMKEELAQECELIREEADYSLKQVSDELDITNYQVSYVVRNPKSRPMSDLIKVYTRLRNMTDPNFKDSKVKYVLHPDWVHPKNGEPFFVASATIANLYDVDINQCVVDVSASEEQKENCVHLGVASVDT